MGFERLIRKVGPFAALAAATALSGCGGMDFTVNGEEGVPLAELDMSGEAPTGVALGGSDAVVITSGDEFTIDVDGTTEAVERMRFVLEGDTLAIGRASESESGGGIATVIITMPTPTTLAVGGSGSITADAMTGNADVAIGGSGSIAVEAVEADSLTIAIGGNGSLEASGTADRLEIALGGSGSADMAGLSAERAEVNIGGSGSATFASDGTVEANIVGSGDVRVIGDATCEANTIGSGSLVCDPAADTDVDEGVEEDT